MFKKAFIISLTLFYCSCSDFYEEDLSSLVNLGNDNFNNEIGLMKALSGAYRPLSYTWSMGLSNSFIKALLMGSDDLTTFNASSNMRYREIDQFVCQSYNSYLSYVWNGLYKSIQGTNNIITYNRKTKGDQEVINQIAGEAYFLRGYCYFWVVRLWGEAPLVLNSDIYTTGNLPVGYSTIKEIYTQIISDLKEAELLLGDKKPQPGRAGKGTAKAILAEVYLQMAGWPLNETSYYPLAAGKAKEVIDNEETYGLGLMDDFAKLWPNASQNFDGNKEEVFALNFSGSADNCNSVYGLSSMPMDEGGWDDYFPELTFFNDFPAGYRKDVTFLTQLKNGLPWQKFITEHPHYKKFRGFGKTHINLISLPLERMAEVYINYAEAQVMATGNTKDAGALEAINKIVRRGAGLPYNLPAPGIDWTVATQDKIVQEKAWEFAGEYSRWFDLVRLKKLEEAVARKDFRELKPFGPVKYYLPIPIIN
jgi:hypothetical protein